MTTTCTSWARTRWRSWCFPWAVTAAAARHVCLRSMDAARIWDLIDAEGVTN